MSDEIEVVQPKAPCAWCQDTGKVNGPDFDTEGQPVKIECREC